MRNMIKNSALLIIVFLLSYLFSVFAGELYGSLFPTGSYLDLRGLSGISIAFIFFLIFLFTAFGGSKKNWLIGIFLIPAFVWEFYIDNDHIYFPIAIGLAGWLVGSLVSYIWSKLIKRT